MDNESACMQAYKVSANEYQLTISPNIREFYGVPAGEKILKLAFVFRNCNGSKTGRDAEALIFLPEVYEEGLKVSFIQPPDILILLFRIRSFPYR